MTNAGLRMELVLYDVQLVSDLPLLEGRIRYNLKVKPFSDIVVEPMMGNLLATGDKFPEKLKLGIIDYERDDANGKPKAYRDDLLHNDIPSACKST